MIRRLAMAWAALGALAWAVPADGQTATDPRSLPDRSALGRIGLERAWFSAVPLQSGLEQLRHLSLTVDGTQIFAQTSAGLLYCYDAETGRMLWTASLGPASGLAEDVAVNSNLAFAINGNFMHALDRQTGTAVWVERMENNASSPVAATEDLVIVGLVSGKLLAFSLIPAEDERFQKQIGAPGGFAWNFSTNGPITAEPIPTEKVVAFSSTGGKLYVSLIDPPRILHRSQPLGELYASMGTYGTGPESLLIVPSRDRNLYGINLFTGEQKWIFPTGSPISAQPLIGGGDVVVTRQVREDVPETYIGTDLREYTRTVPRIRAEEETIPMPPTAYVLNDAGQIFAVDPETGQSRWNRPVPVPGTEREVVDPETGRRQVVRQWVLDPETGRPALTPLTISTGADQILALSPTRIYLTTEYGDLAIVERETGDLIAGPADTLQRAGVNLRAYSLSNTNDVNDRIYLATPGGSIVCLREIGSATPVPIRAQSATPFGHLDDPNAPATETPPGIPAPPGIDGQGDDARANPPDFGFGSARVRP
ncbi:outer membrane protein assembly factor BamB family protein [Tautonia plasticadhaerens]|uniref:Outer membrane biogenesis protein BamB n=1 Tax=Tautonia plasticadhaerens TaxID=2527974 RepID=A0A518GXR9_9BACT|nr:PQQ-binding-like beta-propeller repeat protein [Tautonia plasticadhaerens]QDV33387.1 outer membrane biogenesis protein BamB [Tautonia plasticadhaerens]